MSHSDVEQLAQILQSLTTAGEFGLTVLSHPEASEVAKADASALVDATTRKLHELVRAIAEAEDA